jgi:ActR/RegA family two-component response regulator
MTSKINVLIVDDNDEWRNRFGEAISQETAGQNFECSLAGNYIDALELIAGCENSISVAVIDVCLDKNDLKNEDGLKVADALHKKTERARFVFTYENLSIDQYKRIHTKYQASEVLEKNTAPEDFSDHLLVHAVHEASKKAESLDVFVIMPFKDVYHSFYLNTIKPFFEDRLQICRRADEFFQSGIIMRNIVTYIQAASFSLADLSDRNPNVILEVGIAHALEKNVVMLT